MCFIFELKKYMGDFYFLSRAVPKEKAHHAEETKRILRNVLQMMESHQVVKVSLLLNFFNVI